MNGQSAGISAGTVRRRRVWRYQDGGSAEVKELCENVTKANGTMAVEYEIIGPVGKPI